MQWIKNWCSLTLCSEYKMDAVQLYAVNTKWMQVNSMQWIQNGCSEDHP